MNLGNTIQKLRKDKNIRQIELAEKSGISQTYLSQIEKGIKVPTIDVLEKVSLGLGVPYPVLSYLSIDRSNVPDGKKELYDKFEPIISGLIRDIFL
jgi:transcriptional regulator with XRE-family HTH domain